MDHTNTSLQNPSSHPNEHALRVQQHDGMVGTPVQHDTTTLPPPTSSHFSPLLSSSSSSPLRRELGAWVTLAGPAAARNLVDLLPWLLTLSMIGRVDTHNLAALSLTETYIYSFMCVSWGATSITQATLVSQAHGAGSPSAMRAYSLMTFVASLVLALGVTLVWVFARRALVALGFDPELAALGEAYTLAAIPVLWLEAFSLAVSTHLVSMQAAMLPLAIGVASFLVDIGVSYALIFGVKGYFTRLSSPLRAAGVGWAVACGAGVVFNAIGLRWSFGRELIFSDPDDGAVALADATDMSHVSGGMGSDEGVGSDDDSGHVDLGASERTPLLASATANVGQRDDSGAQSMRAWLCSRSKWIHFLGQLLPNLATVAVFQLQWTVIGLLAVSLGDAELAAHNTMICLLESVHTIALGFAEATAVRVGSHVGRGDVPSARRTVLLSIGIAAAWGAAVGAVGFVLRDSVGRIFTNDADVLTACASIGPFMWGSYAILCVGDACFGVLEGQGRSTAQAIGSSVSVVVSLVLAIVSKEYTSFGLRGLWGSMLLGYVMMDIIAVFLVLTASDWDKLVAKCDERVRKDRVNTYEDDDDEGEIRLHPSKIEAINN